MKNPMSLTKQGQNNTTSTGGMKNPMSLVKITQPLPEIAPYSTNGKFNPLALTQDVHNIAQTARQEQQQSKINEITGGQPTAFMPMKLNVDEIEEAEKVAKKNIEKSNKLNSIVKTPEIMKDNLRRFEDGYNFGDVTKTGLETVGDTVLTVGGTAGDIVLNAAKGVLSVPENMAKAGASAVAGVADLAGADDWANNIRRNVAYKNIYTDPTQKAIDFVDKASIAGTPIDNIASGIGQVGGTVATTYALGKAGLDHVGFMPTTAILQGAGAGATEAYQRADASVGLENMTWKEKLQNALKIGGSAALAGTAEGIFGLFGVGGTPFTTKIGNALINKASTPMLKVLTKMGYSGLGEAGEEFLEYIGNVGLNNLINKFGATDYSTEFDGKEIAKEALTSFIVSAITQGGSSSIQMRNIANQQISQIEKELGRKLTPNEIKKVANNIADQLLIEAEETDVSESSQIEQTQPTNEVIPPTAQNQNTANVVQNNANVQNNVQNNTKIQQSLGINQENTQVPTEIQTFVDARNKTSPGLKVEIDSTINTDGVIIKNADGTRVMKINPKSTRAYEFVAVHEMLHDLENTPEFKELSEFVKQRAITHENFEKAKQAITEQYQKYYQENNLDMSGLNMEIETTNDMVAQALGNQQFLNELAGQKPNVFMRLYNWIKNVAFDGRNTGKTFAERNADNKYLQELKKKFETAYNTAYKGNSGQQFDIITTADNKRYAKATRQVIKGNDSSKWGEQVEKYINEEIRKGQDVSFYGADGELLTITRDTAGKAKFRNEVTMADGTKRKLTDDEYKAKLEAETHIDELAQISKHKNGPVEDTKNHSFAKDGFNYRTAYFEDSDGKYYKITMSVGKNGEINTIYNVGQMKNAQKNRSNTSNRGLKGPSDKIAKGSTTSTNSIPSQSQTVKDSAQSSFSLGENTLPEVQKGYTRLYRGLTQEYDPNYDKSKIDNSNGYESWTDDYELAKAYGDNVYYIDVPTSVIKDSIIDEDDKSETYGDRNLIYRNDKPVGIKGKSGNEYMLYTDHDDFTNIQYNKVPNLINIQEKNYSQSNDEWAKYLSENWDLMPNAKKTSTSEQYQIQQEDKKVMLPTAEQLNQPSQEMIEAAQALTLEEPQNITEKSQQLFDELFANDNLPQTYKFEMGERIERATTLNELEKIRNEIQNYKSDLSKETIDERVVRVNEFIEAQKTKGQQTTKKEIRNKITDLLEIPNKGANVKALSQIAGEINQLLSEGKLTDTRINEIVNALPERVRSINEDFLNEYKELKTELKNRPIYVSENVRKGFPSWSDFKKNNLNKLKLTADNKNITVEQLYQELSGQYEDLFPNDISNPADQLEQISNVVSSIKRDVEDIDTVLISKYGQEGWNEIQDMLKDELKTIRDNLARTDELVEYYEGGIKNRSWTKTSNKNELVNEFLDVKDIQYRVQSNPSTVRMANETLNNLGYEESYNLIKNTIASGRRVKAEDIALGERLIQESIKKGDFERATELISDVTIIGTELGQAVQAMRLINKLSPQGQLMYLQKVVNRMNAQNDQKNAKRDNKKLNELETKVEKGEQIKIGDNEIKIPEESQQELLKAQTQEEIDLAIEKIKEQLAAQLPVETFEKLDEWRYLSMLGRPKSHLRNVLSNIAMRGTYELKNEIQRGVEALAKNSLDERTRTFKKSTKTVKNFAKQSAEDNLNAIKGNGKLTVDKDIKSRRKIFNSELLERARKFNSNALDMEDTVFSKSAYVSNLAEYLTANGIKTQQDIDLNPDIVEKGIQFAIKESQKTTFRQYSALANAMNQVENINGISKVVIGGTLPFKKTPINIAKTGASYSPAGLIETLTLETKKLRDGKITGNEYIDRLSQGLTGTLITGLGYLLADIGVLSGAGEEDDEYAEAIGERAPYSINIGNGHYNLSWLSPTAMPMFIGAEIQKAVQNEEDVDLNNIIDFLATTLDPLSEMSMVSSINDAIKNYGNSETSTGAISSVAGNAIGSYAGQYLPSIFSDINKIIDPTVRSTQASKNSKFKSGERLLRQSLNKLPGGSYLLEPATDIWGNEKKRSDSIFARAADALISPGTYTQKKTTDVDRELMKQYDENSNKDILPKVPKNYFSSNGYKYEMSAKEYTNYKKEYGQTAYKELQKLFSSKEYKEMDSEDKQKAIKDVYEQAQEKARFEYGLNPASLLAKYNEEEASKRLLGAKRSEKQQDSGIALIDFYEAWQAQKDVEGQKNFKGETISGTTKTNKIKAMKEAVPDLSMWELNKLYDVLN